MARSIGFSAQTKTVAAAAAQTIVFSGNDLPAPRIGQSIVCFTLEFTGGLAYSDFNRIRIKSSGSTIVDIDPISYRAWFETYSRDNFDFGAGAVSFPIWLNLQDEHDSADQADVVAFPVNSQPQIEIDIAAGVFAASQMQAGWVLSNIVPVYYPALYTVPMNAGISVNNFSVSLTERGLIKSFGFNNRAAPNGPTRQKVVLGSNTRMEGSQGLLQANQMEYSPGTVVTATGADLWLPFEGMSTASAGNSYLELDTGTATGVGDEYGIWALRAQAN